MRSDELVTSRRPALAKSMPFIVPALNILWRAIIWTRSAREKWNRVWTHYLRARVEH